MNVTGKGLLQAAGIVLVVVVGLRYAQCAAAERDEWEQTAKRALTARDSLRAVADSATAEADSAKRQAEAVADSARNVTPPKPRIVRLREVVTVADSSLLGVVDSLEAAAEGWERAYGSAMDAAASLATANALLRQEADTLRAALTARPKPRPSLDLGILRIELLPTLGVGGFAGASLDGRGVAGAGLTLSWKVRPG